MEPSLREVLGLSHAETAALIFLVGVLAFAVTAVLLRPRRPR
jgi:hypothetical protein